MKEMKIENSQIPICLKICKSGEYFYILRDLSDFYTSESFNINITKNDKLNYKISLTSKLKEMFHVGDNENISISMDYFHSLLSSNDQVVHLQNGILNINFLKSFKSKKTEEEIRKKICSNLLKKIHFDIKKFEVRNKLSLYNFDLRGKGMEFDYIISGYDKARRKSEDIGNFQVLTLDKIIQDSSQIYLISQQNNKNPLINSDDFISFDKNIIPAFFIEGESYYILNAEGKVLDYYDISRSEVPVGNYSNSFLGIGELTFVIFPSKGLDGYIDKIFRKIDNKLRENKNKSQAGKVSGNIKRKAFFTTKRVLSDLEKVLKNLQYSLTKSLKDEIQYDYVQNIKYLNNATLIEISKRINYKYGNDLQEELIKIANQKIAHARKIITYDNDSNRLLKHILIKIQKALKENPKLQTKSKMILKKIKDIVFILKEVKNINNFEDLKIDNSVVLNYNYFTLLKIYNDGLKLISGLSTTIDENGDFIQSVNKMYEIYCFEYIKELLMEDDWVNFKESQTSVTKKRDIQIGRKNKTIESYITHEEYIESDFLSDGGDKIKEVGFLEAKYESGTIRLTLGDIYNKNTLSSKQKEKREIELETKEGLSFLKKDINSNLLYMDMTGKEKYDFSNIIGKEFNFNKIDKKDPIMTPDLSIEIRNNHGYIKKTIIFDAKFSVYYDDIMNLEYPRPSIFKEELNKYQKIGYLTDDVFLPFLKSPIFIMYPGKIKDNGLKKFQSLNNIIRQSYNMMLIPIYDDSDDTQNVKKYIKGLLRAEISK